jgi:hypothetical protein
MNKLLPLIPLLASALMVEAATQGVSFNTVNTNVNQTVHQRFHSITNLAATAGEVAIYNAEKKLVSTNAAGVRGLISAPLSTTTFTIDGTAGEITSSAGAQSLAANRTWTLSLPSVLDFGGKVMEIPNGAAPTTDATGELALDTTITDHAPMLQYFSGSTEYLVISIPRANLDTTDGDVVKYDAATDRFVLSPDISAGGGSAPVGTMVNTGASTQYALPRYSDTTGTNMAPSSLLTDATGTNFYAGGFLINTLTVTNPIPFTSGGFGIATGTSGGIPYFSSSTTVASSAALAANALVIGGGAGAAPSTTTTGTGVITALGVNVGSAGAVVVNGGALGSPSSAGAIQLSEGGGMVLDAVGSADGAFSGITRAGTAGATLAFGDLIYLDPTDSRWELADANSASAADGDARGILGICVLAAASDGSATTILLQGVVRADAVFPAFTINAPIYVSETAGDLTNTSPTTEDNVVRIVGAAWTADEIYFNPTGVWTVYDAP